MMFKSTEILYNDPLPLVCIRCGARYANDTDFAASKVKNIHYAHNAIRRERPEYEEPGQSKRSMGLKRVREAFEDKSNRKTRIEFAQTYYNRIVQGVIHHTPEENNHTLRVLHRYLSMSGHPVKD